MKRYVFMLVLALALTAFAACRKPASPFVDAEIVNVPGKTFDAVILDGHDSGLAPGNAITAIPLCGGDWKAGDHVRILFDGSVMETYPYQLGGVTDVVPLEKGQ